jgi:hypothetical protein
LRATETKKTNENTKIGSVLKALPIFCEYRAVSFLGDGITVVAFML